MEESTGDRGIWPLPEDFVDGAKEEGSGTSRNKNVGTSLVAQWLRTHLPMQGTQVQTHPRRFHVPRGN